ncbi:beta-hexosaminidase [Crepidotus variabilis]|uniref:Beta-hexosaminidase n=1 Tax=Crepidotus variabilis TaxID=179855 RepID=A0A9P6ERC7_9AGAR|nr:beta-hexosaminidase [Crepidotus variabilis]
MKSFHLSTALVLGACQVTLALWPIPRSLQTGSTIVKLSSGFDIQLSGINHAPDDLSDAIERTKSHLQNDKLQRLIVGRGAADSAKVKSAPSINKLTLSLNSGAGQAKSIFEEATKDIGTRSEGYSLSIPGDGKTATISANSTLGLLRGLTTFEQLFYDDGTGTSYTYQAPVTIQNDSPAYPWRGLMLDTARNYFSVKDIKRTLDGMSSVKMSQFHWHIVDSQSFPLIVPEFPELAQTGAYSSGEVYSPSDVQDIVTYAGQRGIDVLVEVDTPGHTSIIAHSHPEHIACFEASPWTSFANEPPAGQLRLASNKTVSFSASLISAIAKKLPSKLFSTGGDEINQNCYTQDAQTQADLAASGKTFEQALDSFTQATHAELKKLGKTPVVWEEMALEHKVTLANNTIVQVWISSQNALAVVNKGLRIVHAPSDYFYLDCGHGGWVGKNVNGNSWCDPFKTWQKAYSFNPQQDIPASSSQLVYGGQQLLWVEQSDPSNLDSIIWPRAASSAEVFWTGTTGPDGSPLDVGTALPRLHDLRYRLKQRGINAIALQPHWCALRPGACDL